MGRPRLHARDAGFWDYVRSSLLEIRDAGHTWTAIAEALGVGKQTLTGFVKRRSPALDAEAVLRLCLVWKVPLRFQSKTIGLVAGEGQDGNFPVEVIMDFDDSFELLADPSPRAILTRKPPSRASYIGIRVQGVGTESKSRSR